ncbi:MAG TPA: class I SAM-dependent methyltransferase [Ktedonobacteraceae bacterium]|nr:class I SAM-dependent methyltransferase [Ktedonobacteraceae bacterium]
MLNDRILTLIDSIDGKAILELGAGNGYFAPLMLRRFSGQTPEHLVITDQSPELLKIAQSSFGIDGANYQTVDVQDPFPFPDDTFQLILASMLFNELTTSGLENALKECARILKKDGQLIATVTHPDLIHALAKKGVLTDFGRGLFAMPSAEGLRLPVSRRPIAAYQKILADCGFTVITEEIQPDEKTLHEKSGLKVSAGTPLGLLFNCQLT